jgi:PAS domain S-box-containing protein
MSWVTIVWSMIASVSFTLATIHLLIWFRERRSWAYLCFFVLAVGVIGLATGEMAAMYAKSPAEYGTAVRWSHFAYGFVAVGSLGFVHFYFGTGKRWLLGAALGLRLLAVVMNFSTGLNLHIGAIQSLQQVNFLGEPVSMLGEWTPNPWVRLGQFAALAQFAYVVDASHRLWRTGSRESRRRAVIVGGPLAFFILFSSGQAGLVAAGVLRMPLVVSFPFLAVLLAMSYELSRDVLRAAQLGRELRESEERMSMAAEAAGFGVWMWSIARNQVWGSERWLGLFGFAPDATVTFENVIQRIHPDDREGVERAVRGALENQGDYAGEYRVVLPDATQRWVTARGRVYPDAKGKPARMLGATIDITARKQAELEVQQQRGELAHLSRVTMLGELSGSLAHELNQPLTAILSNAQAAQRFLAHDNADLNEVRDILADIVAEDKRAGEIIRRLRLLLKKGEVQHQPFDLNEVVLEVLKLIRSDLVNQGVAVHAELAPALPAVNADRVQFQQVLLNLMMNACDAMAGGLAADRKLIIRTGLAGGEGIRVSVADRGVGLPPDMLEKVFEPFFTTKAHGLGLGLSVCRTIITAHGGKLWAANNPERGATFFFTLPVAKEESNR